MIYFFLNCFFFKKLVINKKNEDMHEGQVLIPWVQVAKEFGSFSGYMWGHVNHRPVVGKYRHHKYIPFRTPKSEAVSKDLVRRGFRLVGPVIVYSFMQAAGMAIDHLVDCFRFPECVRLAERSWGITNIAA